MSTLTHLADLAAKHLTPDGRAAAAAATLRQWGEIASAAGAEVAQGDLKATFMFLGAPRDGDLAPVLSRRATCRDLAALLDGEGDAQRAVPVWEAVASHFQGSNDPRQATIAATCERELAELRGE
jgi:hypothetical protein